MTEKLEPIALTVYQCPICQYLIDHKRKDVINLIGMGAPTFDKNEAEEHIRIPLGPRLPENLVYRERLVHKAGIYIVTSDFEIDYRHRIVHKTVVKDVPKKSSARKYADKVCANEIILKFIDDYCRLLTAEEFKKLLTLINDKDNIDPQKLIRTTGGLEEFLIQREQFELPPPINTGWGTTSYGRSKKTEEKIFELYRKLMSKD